MTSLIPSIRRRLDRVGIVLSGLCAAHCLATIVIISSLGIGGNILLDPFWHRAGLVVALIVAAVAIGWGALQHRRPVPFVVAMSGLSFMGGALAVPHGMHEAVLTIIGVALVSLGHVLNIRHTHSSACTERCGD
ncbi:MerC family mercury resistance protein [Altererythrobacter aurantiacus]|uniref:MerC family mercury resistance protein n=1 Tax=Parapontixanthobacter aurantiacus TaxID=1463599 RepID=A0A844ZHZ7_9SPHN|nr:MerC domain-containing protein [Parapontixanthobacter aurantiacus]MXO86872.1 MerC family mercury resistance protein [Parapontixanthobacter aurantiacus]